MFERFTDRSRRVLVLAQEEARLFHHSHIGTEHILLGLIGEEDGIAARTLSDFGITLETARHQVHEIVGVAGSAPAGSPPFTPRAKKVLELSLRETLQLRHSYIGTEHLLLGLIRQGEGVATQVLLRLNANPQDVRNAVLEAMAAGGEDIPDDPNTENSERVHILEGLLAALEDINRVNEIVRGCPNRVAALDALTESSFTFTKRQAREVLDLRVGLLTEDHIQTLRHELERRRAREAGEDEPKS